MIVKMKAREKKCVEYADKRFKKSWELSACSKDSYLEGYRQAVEDCKARLNGLIVGPVVLNDVGCEEVEMEFKDGEHMLGTKMLDKES